MDLQKLSRGDKIILNAVIVAGITFFSSLAATGYPPTIANVYAGVIGAGLAFFTQCRGLTTDSEPPKLGMLL